MTNQDTTQPAEAPRPVRTLTPDEVTLCHSNAVLAQKHDGTDPSFTTLLAAEVQRVFMAVNGLATSGKKPEPTPAEEAYRTSLGDALDAKRDLLAERNKVVALLARLFPSGTRKTDIQGWRIDWYDSVFIDLPTGQVSWPFTREYAELFAALPPFEKAWDGHDTAEKYRRLEAFIERLDTRPAPVSASAADLQATADAVDAEKWRALLGCARVRMLGNAGCDPARPLDPNGDPYGNYAHIGLELWTMHSAQSAPAALAALETFAAKAVAIQRAQGAPSSQPHADVIAKCKSVLALVDDYVYLPTAENRTALRKHLHEEFTAAALNEMLLRAPASEASRLKELLERLRERCANMADDTIVAEFEGVEYYGEKAAERIRTIELDTAVRQFLEASPTVQEAAAAEQSLGLYAKQAEAIRALLDEHVPQLRGSLQTRLKRLLEQVPVPTLKEMKANPPRQAAGVARCPLGCASTAECKAIADGVGSECVATPFQLKRASEDQG